jgi:hypothetical protein
MNCPDVSVAVGLDCECPFNRAAGIININKVAWFSLTFQHNGLNQFIGVSDYEVKIKLNDGPNATLYFGCLNVIHWRTF